MAKEKQQKAPKDAPKAPVSHEQEKGVAPRLQDLYRKTVVAEMMKQFVG